MHRAAVVLLLLATGLGLLPVLRGQQPGPARPAEKPAPGEHRVRVAVELVTTPLVVRDAGGEFLYDLSREDVAVFDNGVPQRLTSFELASEPLSVVLLLDTSQRVAPLLDRVRKSGVLFTSYILGQFGEAAVLSFDSDITLRQEFTSDADKIIAAVERLPAGGADTRLADALDQAVRLLLERPPGRRRAILALTEPLDKGSSTSIGVPLRKAQLTDISVYTVSLSALEADLRRRPEEVPVPRSPYPPGVFPRPGLPGSPQTPTTEAQQQYARLDLLNAIMTLVRSLRDTAGQNVLELYAQGTGGLHFPSFGQAALEQALHHIGQELHNQYLLSYRPTNRDQEGFHRIEVRVTRPGASVRARPGYFVGPPL